MNLRSFCVTMGRGVHAWLLEGLGRDRFWAIVAAGFARQRPRRCPPLRPCGTSRLPEARAVSRTMTPLDRAHSWRIILPCRRLPIPTTQATPPLAVGCCSPSRSSPRWVRWRSTPIFPGSRRWPRTSTRRRRRSSCPSPAPAAPSFILSPFLPRSRTTTWGSGQSEASRSAVPSSAGGSDGPGAITRTWSARAMFRSRFPLRSDGGD